MPEHVPNKTQGLNDHYGNKYNLNPHYHHHHQQQQQQQQHHHHLFIHTI
jgi:hypothetical protein